MALPIDWQEQVLNAADKMRAEKPGEALAGLRLPESWKSELQKSARQRELHALFHVKVVVFEGNSIQRWDPAAVSPAPKIDKKKK